MYFKHELRLSNIAKKWLCCKEEEEEIVRKRGGGGAGGGDKEKERKREVTYSASCGYCVQFV
jgi:hypothetical protein